MNLEDFTTEMFGPRGTPKREELERSMSISRRTDRFLEYAFGWTRRIPLVGRVVWVFWSTLFSHDMEHYVWMRPSEVLHPWGALGFSFLNDGMKPSLWHVWVQMRHDNGDPYTGIYPGGAPRNRREADAVIANER